MTTSQKLSFQEAWDSSTIFFVDEELEQEIEEKVESLLETAKNHRVSESAKINVSNIANFLSEKRDGIDVILKDIGLSEEKFKRIVSLLRKLERIPGKFKKEWGMAKIKSKMSEEEDFANLIAKLLVDGKRDKELKNYNPRYYLDYLNYRKIKGSTEAARKLQYKQSLAGTYGGRKGYYVEAIIEEELNRIQEQHEIGYEKGRSRFIETDIDFAIPNLDDPWVIIMVSFQETTSSGQSTKARDMLSAYERICRQNSRHRENRAFINFADGGGWLARKTDFKRLVENCHYFINLQNLNMLESIALKHLPDTYLT